MSAYIIDELAGSGKLNISGDGMGATRLARCHWNNWPAAVLSLMGVPVWYGGTLMIIGRQSYPGIPYLQVDSVDVEGMGTMYSSSWSAGPSYRYGKLSITYKTPDEEDNKDENGSPGTYLIESLDYSVEVAVVPVLVADHADKDKLKADADFILKNYVSSNPDGSPAPIPIPPAAKEAKKKTVKRHIRIPTITYTTTLPRLPILPHAEIRNSIGRLNKTSIFGGKPGTVLFDGPNAERESVFFTRRFWRCTYKFMYQPFGWNKTLHPDTLKWVEAKALGSDNNPYEYAELKKLFPRPYNVRS